MKPKKTIIIDAATIYPGKGGAGGGIWSYAANLLTELDAALDHGAGDVHFLCLVNADFNLPLKNIRVKKIAANLKNFPLRLVYVHLYLPALVYSRKAVLHKLYFEVPFFSPSNTIVTIHDCMSSFYKKKKYTRESLSKRLQYFYFDTVNDRAIRKSKLICTPSGFIKNEIVENYKTALEKVIVTPLATSMKARENSNNAGNAAQINIYCIAAFHSHKGHLRLIDVFEQMLTRHKIPARLFFRGHIHDHDYYKKILTRIDRSAVKERIGFIEYDRKSDISDIYQHADWVVLLSEYEGFGLPIIEAQANGIPVICSDIPVFGEVGGDSVLYLNGAWSLARQGEKMYEYIIDKTLRENIVRAGYRNLERYSWKKFAQQMLKIYEEI
ncbi:MAG TPA: glycosyltransferase family 1 protein [Chitinophagaceae bacterium]|nr:glycosyltransferase family 1 protein [Chitinophagaceae bacterium]